MTAKPLALSYAHEHYQSQLQRLVLTRDNKCSCCQCIVQYQRIVLTLEVSLFIVSLVHVFKVPISLESTPIRTIGIRYTVMTMHSDTMADQGIKLHICV